MNSRRNMHLLPGVAVRALFGGLVAGVILSIHPAIAVQDCLAAAKATVVGDCSSTAAKFGEKEYCHLVPASDADLAKMWRGADARMQNQLELMGLDASGIAPDSIAVLATLDEAGILAPTKADQPGLVIYGSIAGSLSCVKIFTLSSSDSRTSMGLPQEDCEIYGAKKIAIVGRGDAVYLQVIRAADSARIAEGYLEEYEVRQQRDQPLEQEGADATASTIFVELKEQSPCELTE
ncbi:hypothetical protein [Dongia sp.]|uniref:hypothetical protein n=1 Tax=Dongia sp. TaxID=1977262 RepID=UPI0035B12A21